MKRLLVLLLFLPILAAAQLDFESYTGNVDFIFLPEVESLDFIPLSNSANFLGKNSYKLPSFGLNKNNYRQPVSMFEAMESAVNYVDSDITASLNAKNFGISAGNSSYTPDGSTKVRNFVYKDASQGFLFSGVCPPHGICPRCAPFRRGNSFY